MCKNPLMHLVLPVWLGLFVVLTALSSNVSAAEKPATLKLPPGLLKVNPRPAPALKLKDLDGESFELAPEKNQRWAFVHFWASWCGPCRREMPTVEALSKQLEALSMDFVLVNTAETEDTVFNFMAIAAPELSTLLDSDGLVTEQWQPRGLPASFIVNPDRQIVYLALGGRRWTDKIYIDFLKQLLKQNGKE